jgi:hypothetical protein
MKDYMYPNAGNMGNFGNRDSAGRPLDSAGKLVIQTARKDLKDTDQKDLNRKPEFKHF